MGARSSMLQEEEISEIHKETGFSSNQIVRLYSRFTNLDKSDQGFLRRADFLRIPELAINPLGDRIVHAFFQERHLPPKGHNETVFLPDCQADDLLTSLFGFGGSHFAERFSGGDTVNFRQFMRVLARFRPVKKNMQKNILNDREEKLKFAFKMYDLDGDNMISRDELLNVLHMMVGANISDEQLGSIADRTILEVDLDKDQFISFEEFVKAMERVDVEQKMSIRFLN